MNAKEIAIQYASKKVRNCIPLASSKEETYKTPSLPYGMVFREVKKKKGFLLQGTFSLPHLIVESVCLDFEGRNGRQWLKLSDDLPQKMSSLKEEEFVPWLAKNKSKIAEAMSQDHFEDDGELWLSRTTSDWRGNKKPPIRIWKQNKDETFSRFDGEISVGDLIVASCDEIRGYFDKDNKVGITMELNRDIVLVKKQEKSKKRKIMYFSDSE